MLYEFHRKQNSKKPGSVHATYLITGTRRAVAPQTNGTHSQDDEDTDMQSSQLLPSSSAPKPDETMEEPTSIRSIMLVKEEHLEQARATLDSISSIHVYSLEANGLSDVQSLTECNRKVTAGYASEDPLQEWKKYGTIQNPNAKRRTRRTAPPPPPPVQDIKVKTSTLATSVNGKDVASIKSDSKASSAKPTPEPEKKAPAKPAQTKRQNSDIFKSFAKSKTKPKGESQSSAEATPAPEAEDEPMGGFSEDEVDDGAPDELAEETKDVTGKSKKDREAEIKAMMDEEDEEMEDAPGPDTESLEPENAIDKAEPPNEEPKESVTVENGRRRGRRRVMKKKTVKDEEGYLGTYLLAHDI